MAAGVAYHRIRTRSRCYASHTRGGKGGGGIYLDFLFILCTYLLFIFMSVLDALQFCIISHIHS